MASPRRGQTGKMEMCVEREGEGSMGRTGEATPKAEPGSQRMKITAANVSNIY